MSKKKKFYAIKIINGIKDKIVATWKECKKLVIGYPSIYKSFENEKKANEYSKNMTKNEVKLKLIWNEIHIRNRIKDKFEQELGFNIPRYIIDEAILLKKYKTSSENLSLLINLAHLNKRISEKNAQKLKKYIMQYIEMQ